MKKIIFAFFIILLLAGCSSKNDSPATSNFPAPGFEDVPEAIVIDQDNIEIKEISITAKQWEFDPNQIIVNKGDKVKLSIKSLDVSHGFYLPSFDINKRLEPGKTETVEFIADKAGKFVFSCDVFCGSGHSDMYGSLIVEEA